MLGSRETVHVGDKCNESKLTNIGIGMVVGVGYRWKRDHFVGFSNASVPLRVNMKSRGF